MSELRTTRVHAVQLPPRTQARAQAEYDAARRMLTREARERLEAAEAAETERVLYGTLIEGKRP